MRRRRDNARWEARWLPLATYNAEVARGIVHTPEWDAHMATWQRMFDADAAERYAGKPRYVPERPDPTVTS